MTSQRSARIVGHVLLALMALAGTLWALQRAEEHMGSVAFVLLVYAVVEGGWALAAHQNQREYARNPRRPILNEMAGLVGAEAVVTQACSPRGQVRLEGAIWLADARSHAPIPQGARVTVAGYLGLVLTVEPLRPRAIDDVA